MSSTLPRRRAFLLHALAGTAGFAFAGTSSPRSLGNGGNAADVAPQPIANRLAEYVHRLRYEDIDASALEALKLRLVDTFGCALAALKEPVVQRCFDVAEAATNGASTLVGTGQRTTPELAAFANGAAIRYYDLNDGYAAKEIGHPSDFISVSLAVAQAERRPIEDFVLASLIAYEIECRLFDAAAISPLGWDNPSYGVVTAALTAGKLMQLSVDQLTQAVNIALIDHVAMNQTRTQVLSNWKGLADASAAKSGFFAATLARQGITGPSPIFEGNFGFEKLVSGHPIPIDTATFGGRGHPYRIVDVLVKPYPAQGHTLTAVEAAIRLSAKIKDRSQIEKIVVATTEPGYKITGSGPYVWAPATKETADHSMPYVVGRALIDGTLTNESYAPEKLGAADVRELMQKIRVEEDPALTALYPKHIPNRVSVYLRSGDVLSERVDDLPGAAGAPLTRPMIEAKFWRTVGKTVTRENGDALIERIWSIERLHGVDALLEVARVEKVA
ncbi:MmgE/PrpD family protein [Trinickia sp. NRRL B-1857]|uniref:MmgE/PrpD family protein n=1 Tax=Trinickia sp. NRRL B-1857 TaxID=3162879 RepID=UPI003D2C03B0